jgi:hypothetical protein
MPKTEIHWGLLDKVHLDFLEGTVKQIEQGSGGACLMVAHMDGDQEPPALN